MKLLIKPLLFFIAFGCIAFHGSAQDTKIVKVPKFKPPVVTTYLGVNTNGATVTVDEAVQLIALPLKITDTKNNSYSIVSYGFVYKRKGAVEDEETGLKKISFTTVADKFQTTPLPKVWIDNLKNGFQKDEQLYFYDVLVKDNQDRKFYAPDLKITIQ